MSERTNDAPRQGHTPGPDGCHNPHCDGSMPEGVLRPEACGCIVIGSGTIPHPFEVRRCLKHDAAPDLLEVLRDAYWALKGAGKVGDADAIRAAIAKAEGR